MLPPERSARRNRSVVSVVVPLPRPSDEANALTAGNVEVEPAEHGVFGARVRVVEVDVAEVDGAGAHSQVPAHRGHPPRGAASWAEGDGEVVRLAEGSG